MNYQIILVLNTPNYVPDMIWFDSWFNMILEEYRKKMLAHHYNTAVNRGKEPFAYYKQEDLPDSVAIVDIEQGGKTAISEKYWLTDIILSLSSWSYTDGMKFKSPGMVIRNMIDVWSKKGVVLLNVSPKANGEITQEQQDILKSIGDWIRMHEDAVYQTRAYSIFGYGIADFVEGEFGGQAATMEYTMDDIRFATSKDGTVLYVYILGMPVSNTDLALDHVFDTETGKEIKRVSVIGSGKELSWRKEGNLLLVQTPNASAMNEIATVLKVQFY